MRLAHTLLEDGTAQAALQMHPKWVARGTIKGWLPWVTIPDDARLLSRIGFSEGAGGSDGVTFQVWVHRNVGGRQAWSRVFSQSKIPDGRLLDVEIDLSSFAGQTAGIELRVDAGDSAGRDWAAWVDPRIVGPSEATTATVLRVLHYNVQFLLRRFLGTSHWPKTESRAREIGRVIADYDLISLNEAFIPRRREAILESAESHAANQPGAASMPDGVVFDTSHGPIREHAFQKNGGLACLSRMPIVGRHHHIFSDGAGIDSASAKGVLHCVISRDAADPDADLLDVFLSHMQDDDVPVQTLQIQELERFIARHVRAGQPAILMGDFNGDGPIRSSPTQVPLYRLLRKALTRLGFVDLWPASREGGGTNGGANRRIDHIWMRDAALLECDTNSPAGLDVLEMADTAGVGHDGRLSDHRAVAAVIEWRRSEPASASAPSEMVRVTVSVKRLRATSADAWGGRHDFYGSVEFESGLPISVAVPVITEGDDVEPVNLLDSRRFRRAETPRALITIRDEDGPLRGGPDDDVDINPFDEGTALRIEIDLQAGYVYSVDEGDNRDLRLGRIGAFLTVSGNSGDETADMTFQVSAIPE